MNLGKFDLIDRMAEINEGLTKKAAGEALDVVLNTIVDAIENGDEINLVGYFKMGVKTRAARSGRNIKTKEILQIPAKNVPYCKFGKKIKDAAE